MSQREEFAKAAMQGLLVGRNIVEHDGMIRIDASLDGIAALARLAADALIDELEDHPPPAYEAEQTKAGAASPRAVEQPTTDAAAQEPAISPVAVTAGNPASPVHVWDCEARFDKDPVCHGPVEFDPVTRGRFCGFHLAQVPEGHRREMHRLHGHRNRPAEPVARLAG